MADEWFYQHHGRIHGPVSLHDLQTAISLGFALPTDLVRHRVTVGWAAAETFTELNESLHREGEETQMKNTSRRIGFTLVELLVVIAIIGTLIGLLLPAVQSAREAGRRISCTNNLKQLAIGLLNHEHSLKTFPPGGVRCPTADFYGHSWWIPLLPFIEETALHDRFDKSGNDSGTQYDSTGWIGLNDHVANLHNRTLLSGRTISAGICPSSPINAQFTETVGGVTVTYFAPHYVGIAGSSDHSSSFTMVGGNGGGITSYGGILPPELSVRAQQVTDGMSKTLLLAEQSDFSITASGERKDCRSSRGGFSMSLSSYFRGDPRVWNVTTVRHPISKDWDLTNACYEGGPMGSNAPLQSAHPGIVLATFADGSVRSLNETLQVSVLKNMADRDDGGVVSSY